MNWIGGDLKRYKSKKNIGQKAKERLTIERNIKRWQKERLWNDNCSNFQSGQSQIDIPTPSLTLDSSQSQCSSSSLLLDSPKSTSTSTSESSTSVYYSLPSCKPKLLLQREKMSSSTPIKQETSLFDIMCIERPKIFPFKYIEGNETNYQNDCQHSIQDNEIQQSGLNSSNNSFYND